MPPIYETDIAAQRWNNADWENYELWERVAIRDRRRKLAWVLATVLCFFVLSSIPIALDRWDKWSTLSAARKLAGEVNWIKLHAGLDHVAYRLKFDPSGRPEFQIEKAQSCADPHPVVVRSERLFAEAAYQKFTLMTDAMGSIAGIPNLVTELCYDSLSGSDTFARKSTELVGFGIAPVKDLSEGRLDRVSVLTVTGPSAETYFD